MPLKKKLQNLDIKTNVYRLDETELQKKHEENSKTIYILSQPTVIINDDYLKPLLYHSLIGRTINFLMNASLINMLIAVSRKM